MKEKYLFFLTVSLLFLGLSLFSPLRVNAQPADKINICHATAAHNNPYITNNVDKNATAGGHDGHTGPIWFEGIQETWGDIIPPYEFDGGSFSGLNWTAMGEAIWENGCNIPDPVDEEPEEPEEEEEEEDEEEVAGVTDDDEEVLGTTVVLAETGASGSILVYIVQTILMLSTLVSGTLFVKEYTI